MSRLHPFVEGYALSIMAIAVAGCVADAPPGGESEADVEGVVEVTGDDGSEDTGEVLEEEEAADALIAAGTSLGAKNSDAGRVIIVDKNMGPETDGKIYIAAAWMTSQKYVPDIVILQEANHVRAETLRVKLNERVATLGITYQKRGVNIGGSPERNGVYVLYRGRFELEEAYTQTRLESSNGRCIAATKVNYYARLHDKLKGESVDIADVHYPPNTFGGESYCVDDNVRRTNQMLNAKWPNGNNHLKIIAGDFNEPATNDDGSKKCWYRYLEHRDGGCDGSANFRDPGRALVSDAPVNGIDFIFARRDASPVRIDDYRSSPKSLDIGHKIRSAEVTYTKL